MIETDAECRDRDHLYWRDDCADSDTVPLCGCRHPSMPRQHRVTDSHPGDSR